MHQSIGPLCVKLSKAMRGTKVFIRKSLTYENALKKLQNNSVKASNMNAVINEK